MILKTTILLGLSATLASAWFMPTMSFGNSDDNTHVDKNFVRDAQKEVVINTKASKMYSDTKASSKMHFFAAWEYCQNMTLAGYEDWRVISKEEAKNLLELSRQKVNVKHAFRNVEEDIYWTSTQDRYEQAWFVDFDLGRYSIDKYTDKHRVICSRDTKE